MKRVVDIFILGNISIMIAFCMWISCMHEVEIEKIEVEKVNDSEIEYSRTVEEPTIYEVYEKAYIEKFEELENTPDEDLQIWYLEYREMICEFSKEYEDIPGTIYDYYNADELMLLFRIVQSEVGDEHAFYRKANVASVIFNRANHTKDGAFGEDLTDILTMDKQFSVYSNGSYKKAKVSCETIQACEFAFEIKDTTNGCLYFDSNGYHLNDKRLELEMYDGAHYFYKVKEDNNDKG